MGGSGGGGCHRSEQATAIKVAHARWGGLEAAPADRETVTAEGAHVHARLGANEAAASAADAATSHAQTDAID